MFITPEDSQTSHLKQKQEPVAHVLKGQEFTHSINPYFMFLTKAEKIRKIEEYKQHPDRIINILKQATPDLISRYLSNSKELSYIIEDLNKSELSKLQDDGMIDKFFKL